MAIKFPSSSPQIVEYSMQEIKEVASYLISKIKQNDTSIFGLTGELGAGKTTLIKEIAKQLGVKGIVKSPTYSIQCDYEGLLNGNTLLVSHWDLFRISESEAIEMYDEYLREKSTKMRVLYVEWAERLHVYSSNFTQIEISELVDSADNLSEKSVKDIHERRIISLKCPEIDK